MSNNLESRDRSDPQDNLQTETLCNREVSDEKSNTKAQGESRKGGKASNQGRRRVNLTKATHSRLKRRHTPSDVNANNDFRGWDSDGDSERERSYSSPISEMFPDLDRGRSRRSTNKERLYSILRTKYDYVTRENAALSEHIAVALRKLTTLKLEKEVILDVLLSRVLPSGGDSPGGPRGMGRLDHHNRA